VLASLEKKSSQKLMWVSNNTEFDGDFKCIGTGSRREHESWMALAGKVSVRVRGPAAEITISMNFD
jgi:hypothetical protein